MYELGNRTDTTANELAGGFRLLTTALERIVGRDAAPEIDEPVRDPYVMSAVTVAMLGAMTSAVMLCEGRDLASKAGIGTVKYSITTPKCTRALKITDIAKGFPDLNRAHGRGANADLSRRWILSMDGRTKPGYLTRGTIYDQGDHGPYIPPEQPADARPFGSIEGIV